MKLEPSYVDDHPDAVLDTTGMITSFLIIGLRFTSLT